jgi:hypothetical protein
MPAKDEAILGKVFMISCSIEKRKHLQSQQCELRQKENVTHAASLNPVLAGERPVSLDSRRDRVDNHLAGFFERQ